MLFRDRTHKDVVIQCLTKLKIFRRQSGCIIVLHLLVKSRYHLVGIKKNQLNCAYKHKKGQQVPANSLNFVGPVNVVV